MQRMMLEELKKEVEAFLVSERMSATALGREAVSDPNFVHDLRKGREPRFKTVRAVTSFMQRKQKGD
ncbi:MULTISPECIES: hypothetical protein [Halocynthiibacter]|uniref:Uncharacterized protein n=1 Tax=Halocynthiibacter halioticoli TaxID=2986804 RepID=A0AAE3J1F9_9RHOB|nr:MULTISPECIES: hypothetical protein [Halocynthiibacter]MCV6826023.1 hypothetical protein [Halocynthiibacter halioticoli]MCW4059024.1 hypothetical protein [Halocynthiibacter sp. SDUM655004]